MTVRFLPSVLSKFEDTPKSAVGERRGYTPRRRRRAISVRSSSSISILLRLCLPLTKFARSHVVDQDVTTLDISVNFLFRMQVRQSRQCVLHDARNLRLAEGAVADLHDIAQGTGGAVFLERENKQTNKQHNRRGTDEMRPRHQTPTAQQNQQPILCRFLLPCGLTITIHTLDAFWNAPLYPTI